MNSDFHIQSLGQCEIDSPLPSSFFLRDETHVLVDSTVSGCERCAGRPEAVMEKAGPREKIFFDPAETRAAIVTCGGLCPGMNNVIRSVTMVLWYRYGVREIWGLRFGFEGLIKSIGHQPINLTPEVVEDIHQDGGTILGSSRGPQDVSASVDYLVENGINMLFAIGGDGTLRGAREIANEIVARGANIAIVGIPKTIDNDILYTDRTFGFETAVARSQAPITAAHMEAKGVRNGIGLVKLMGRESGFIATYATLASSDVNLLLVPEVPFSLEDVMSYLEARLEEKSHAVILVAEGAGQDFTGGVGVDASGNKVLGDIGVFLKKAVLDHFKARGIPVAVKYIDPSYIIRSAPASADDAVFCFQLAQNAVHAAVCGKTALVIGLWNGHFVHVPIERAVEDRKRIDPAGLLWQSVLDNTGQPL